MARIETKLAQHGLTLPQPLVLPPGVVLPFPEVNLRGNRAYVSGAGPLNDDGSLAGPFGKVGIDVSVEDAAALAQKTGLAILAGLIFLPWTTLALSWSTHRTGGELETWSWILIIIAVVFDLGATKGGPSWSKDGD